MITSEVRSHGEGGCANRPRRPRSASLEGQASASKRSRSCLFQAQLLLATPAGQA